MHLLRPTQGHRPRTAHDFLRILKPTNSRRERSAGNMTFAILLLPLIFAANAARAQQYTESVLYTFPSDCSLGCEANQGLIQDSVANLYGTTLGGGTQKPGTAFRLDTKGASTVLHNFTGKLDGGNPYAGLIMDQAGNSRERLPSADLEHPGLQRADSPQLANRPPSQDLPA
jgi:uncharacterized repeat protein (TIGR03803 family)